MDLIIKNNDFKFSIEKQLDLEKQTLDLPISEHLAELRQRVFQFLAIAILAIIVFFLKITPIVELLEAPVKEIKFIQLSPGEYFISTVKIALYGGLLVSMPFLISQVIFYIVPALTEYEQKIVVPILTGSTILFNIGLVFAYYLLIPAALSFFIGYSKDVIEPFWSFEEYFDFIVFLFYSTGFSFQVPVIQIILGLIGIIDGKAMLNYWRYVILGATIISAVLTPSTDPITQLILTFAILFLYFTGAFVLIFLEKYVIK